MKGCHLRFWLLESSVLFCLWVADPTAAQIAPDATLPNNSTVNLQGTTRVIEGGTTAGGNLFHSFREFSVPTGGEAFFNNTDDIQNIFSRVTGGSISNIDGLIRANGRANLFLLNPNGIIFGPNARLNIGGSFVGSTASSIRFADGTEFSATNPQAPPLLTINVPIGLQFAANSPNPNPAIIVQGAGNNLSLDPNTAAIIRENRSVGLGVSPNQTLALVGGDVTLEGGNLTAGSGRIELGSVAPGSLVALTPAPSGWQLGYEGVQSFQDISLKQAASVDASGNGGGSIQLSGRRITLADGSAILSLTEGSSPGSNLTIRASESVELIGESADGQFTSRLATNVQPKAIGNGGDLIVETGRLIVRDGALISASTFGAGQGGTLRVTATDSVEVIGRSADGQIGSGLRASAERDSTGDGGDLTIETRQLLVKDGAQTGVSTFGAGQGGTLRVTATDSVEVIGESADGQFGSVLAASAESGSTGDGGNLTIETGQLIVKDGSQIGAGTFGAGQGGTLRVKATDSVEVIGSSADGQFGSALFASTLSDATGDGGDLTIATGRLLVKDGAQISVDTFGVGQAGTLTVKATDSVEVIGTSASNLFSSGLFASAVRGSTGDGGDLTIETRRLLVKDGALVNVATFGAGRGGTLIVKASDSVEVIGRSANDKVASRLFADAGRDATGEGGDLTIETRRLLVKDGAQISAGTFGAGQGGTLIVKAIDSVEVIGRNANGQIPSGLFADAETGSTGNGGNLTIETGRLLVKDGATVGAGTFGAGQGGTLIVKAIDSVVVIGTSANGQIPSGLFASAESGSTGDGGDLTIETGRLIVRDGATVRVSSRGTGKAGTLVVNADSIQLSNQASLNADTKAGGGSINLRASTVALRDSRITTNATGGDSGGDIIIDSQFLQLRDRSNITTNATGTQVKGGNIILDTDVVAALENSDISANSDNFFGGRVSINTQAIFGTQFRLASTLESDITATGGAPELSGIVEINTPDVDPSSGLIELPANFVDITGQIVQDCPTGTRFADNEFFITGRGGIPPTPREALSQNAIEVDWVTPNPQVQEGRGAGESPIPSEIVEATGWVRGANGEVILTANPPTATPYETWYRSILCPAPQSNN